MEASEFAVFLASWTAGATFSDLSPIRVVLSLGLDLEVGDLLQSYVGRNSKILWLRIDCINLIPLWAVGGVLCWTFLGQMTTKRKNEAGLRVPRLKKEMKDESSWPVVDGLPVPDDLSVRVECDWKLSTLARIHALYY
ncbi:hypothetical protein BJX64DRAFT_65132 [Aspergillus heterothallicus]